MPTARSSSPGPGNDAALPREVSARAPGRIDLAGGGTDPEPYCSDFGGAVLNVAIALHTHVRAARSDGGRVRIRTLDLDEAVEGPAGGKFSLDGPLSLLKAMANRFDLSPGAEIASWTELPRASGLSTSASLGVAMLGALARLSGRALERAEIAHLHSEVERFDLGIWGGKQDPFACAFGGLRFWRFEGEKVIEEPMRLPEWVEPELERSLALVYSGEAHLSGNIHNEILADYRQGESRVKAAQHRLKEVALAAREALEGGDLGGFAELLNENWKAHQRLHESCATPRLHDLIARGLSSGAVGAKVCGAGGGGCIVFLVFPEERRALERAMIDAGARLLPLKLDRDGLMLWRSPWTRSGSS